MASHEKGRPLPKFGEWDVNNPASADGFTVIFAKARDDKKATGTATSATPPQTVSQPNESYKYSEKVLIVWHARLDTREWDNYVL